MGEVFIFSNEDCWTISNILDIIICLTDTWDHRNVVPYTLQQFPYNHEITDFGTSRLVPYRDAQVLSQPVWRKPCEKRWQILKLFQNFQL